MNLVVSGCRAARKAALIAASGGFLLLQSPLAEARSRGLASSGCVGCHGEAENSVLVPPPVSVTPGQTATIEFAIEDPDATVGGIFIGLEDTSIVSVGNGMALVNGGITHTTPRRFQNGRVTFDVTWTVPSTPGATRFVVAALAGNGNGQNSGDEANAANFDIVYGCEPQLFWQDLDGDGHGRESLPRVLCAGTPPKGFAEFGDDCDDNFAERHPDAVEICNRKDDDCDGEIDEQAIPAELYPDADGDGYYSTDERLTGEMVIGCVPLEGYAAEGGDCSPENASVNPGTEEVCDMALDEDCDGRVDELVRPICGIGWCRRESRTCNIEDCTPGDPVPEVCNFLDDDCDDLVDEGDLCPAGQECLAGECRPALTTTASTSGSDPASQQGKLASSGCSMRPVGSRSGAWVWLFTAALAALALVRAARLRVRH